MAAAPSWLRGVKYCKLRAKAEIGKSPESWKSGGDVELVLECQGTYAKHVHWKQRLRLKDSSVVALGGGRP